MGKLKQICQNLFNNNADSGRYKAIVSESYKHSSLGLKICVLSEDQNEIVQNVNRRMKNSHADKIEISDVFYQASKDGFFETARLTPQTQREIEVYNNGHHGQDMNPDL